VRPTTFEERVSESATGQRLDDLPREQLFAPLGVDEVWWWTLRDDLVYAPTR
jgi:CubicO group peptidase (beta-lactamase class C family)